MSDHRLRTVGIAVGIALCWASQAHAAPDINIPFERYTLENGLEVILHQDRRVSLVHVNVWYHVGSADEQPGMSGFATCSST